MPLLFDTLESRQLFAVSPPSNAEQYLIELINRARQDPTGTAAAIGVPLNEGLPANTIATGIRQPLAVSGFLTDAAQFHAEFLRAAAQVSLVGLNGSTPTTRIAEAGYPAGGTLQSSAENVTAEFGIAGTGGGTGTLIITRATVDAIFRNMFVDAADAERTNRINLFNGNFREIGAGLASGLFGGVPGTPGGGNAPIAAVGVVDFARTNGNPQGDIFLTGVAYRDTDNDRVYSLGEGLGNVTVSARRVTDNQVFTTTTFGSGGYSLRVPTGTYDVVAQGAGIIDPATNLPGAVRYTSVIVGGGTGTADDRNVKRDILASQATTTPPAPGPILPPGANPVTLKGDVTGKVLLDRKGDGKRESLRFDPVVVGTRVYVDTDNDAILDANESFGVVLESGNYTIPGITAGIYNLRVDAPAGFRVSAPGETFRTVRISSGRLARAKSFAITERTIISGRVYRDDNINGQFDETTDRGLRDFRVYLDLNSDGLWQRETEPSRKSDSAGRYAFRDLLAGTYTVRIIPKVAFIQTEPPGTGAYIVQLPNTGVNVINRDFGERLIG